MKNHDIMIVGAGYVGLCTALAIKNAAPHLDVCIVDGAPKSAIDKDNRASAIAAGAAKMLDQLGIWDGLLKKAQPINKMVVTDSKLSDPVRPVFLNFEAEEDGEAFAHMVANRDLIGALRKKCEALNITCNYATLVDSMTLEADHGLLLTNKGNALKARLIIAADGIRSKLRDLSGIKTTHWPYGQIGIVTTVKHERPHEGCAYEHFLPAGPFATLPLAGNRSSLVWTEPTTNGERILAMDDLSFELELERRFGHKLGELQVDGPKRGYPLGLTLARDYVKHRFALAGDAAHGIHPIAGQGLNLGFKDAAALAQTIVEADRLGMDFGTLDILENYQRWRRFDSVQMGAVTDVLNRLFANDNPLIRAARGFGLGVVDRLPGLKRQFIGQAAQISGPLPNLIEGRAI